MTKKVLLTGVTGLMGNATYSHLAAQLSCYEVYGLDRQADGFVPQDRAEDGFDYDSAASKKEQQAR